MATNNLPPVLNEINKVNTRIDNLGTGSGETGIIYQDIVAIGEISPRPQGDRWWPKSRINIINIQAGQSIAPSTQITTIELIKNTTTIIATVQIPIGVSRTDVIEIENEQIILPIDHLTMRIINGSGSDLRVRFGYKQLQDE